MFCLFGPFFELLPPEQPGKLKILKKMKRGSRDVIILHMCTKNHYHMMYATSDMEYLSF